MALSKSAKIALAILGTTVVVGGVAYAIDSSKPKSKTKAKAKARPALTPTEEGFTDSPPAMGRSLNPAALALPRAREDRDADEWRAHWARVKDQLIPRCRDDVGQSKNASFTALWRCLARRAFPQAAIGDFDRWPAWLRGEASAQIRRDLKEHLEYNGVSMQGWSFMLWLRLGSVIDGCYEALAPHSDAIAHCVALEIYPDVNWPPTSRSPTWQREVWETIVTLVDTYVARQESST
jgi:hypothetical protein